MRNERINELNRKHAAKHAELTSRISRIKSGQEKAGFLTLLALLYHAVDVDLSGRILKAVK